MTSLQLIYFEFWVSGRQVLLVYRVKMLKSKTWSNYQFLNINHKVEWKKELYVYFTGNMKPWHRRQVKRQIEALQSAGLSHLSDTEPSSEESGDTQDTSWSDAKDEESFSCHMSFHFQVTHQNLF